MNKTIGIFLVIIIVLGGAYLMFDGGEKNEILKEAPVEEVMEQKVIENKPDQSDAMKKEDNSLSMASKGETVATPGTYEVYAPEKLSLASSDHDVVLFFRASWCPSCRALDADIKSNLSKIPKNINILDVNYDNSSSLKQKYGVTYQHTLVQVDKDGNMIKKWSGSPTLSALVGEVK